MAKILFTAFGSLGDLHPMMALALELKRRGHAASVATHEIYREKITAEGLGFFAVRPHIDPEDKGLISKVMGSPAGSRHLTQKVLLPAARATYEDVFNALEGADLLVNHMLIYPGPMAAEKRRVPWASVALSPICLLSAYDPPTLGGMPALNALLRTHPIVARAVMDAARRLTHSWSLPLRELRAELELPPSTRDPLAEGLHSETLSLALFSGQLARPQRDWPRNVSVTGFASYDKECPGAGLEPELERFLAEGEAPIVFTLGSAAVMNAGDFYESSAVAAERLGRRAVLLVGKDPANAPTKALPRGVAVFNYAPYSKLFPRAAAIVHQGGIGTTGQAMAAGRPMLVVPYGIDQPDNAARLRRLGVARVLPRAKYTASGATRELEILLSDARYATHARACAIALRREAGLSAACDALERLLPAARQVRPPEATL